MQERYGICPSCGSAHLQLTAGDQMRVKDMVVE
jgi:Zn finger protein HypA/HybF involved in hydrogenase expression